MGAAARLWTALALLVLAPGSRERTGLVPPPEVAPTAASAPPSLAEQADTLRALADAPLQAGRCDATCEDPASARPFFEPALALDPGPLPPDWRCEDLRGALQAERAALDG